MVSSRILVILWSVAAILVLTAACGREVSSRQDGVSSEDVAMAARLAAQAVNRDSGSSQQGILVTGTGTATAEPDLAIINLGVQVLSESVGAALEEANHSLEAMLAVLSRYEIEERDTQTRRFNISTQYDYRQDDGPVVIGYQVTNELGVKMRDLSNIGPLIEDVVTAGGNAVQVNGINFTIEDDAALRDEALMGAVESAMAQAERLAELSGVEVGKLVRVVEVGNAGPVASRAFEQAIAVSLPAAAAPVRSGSLDVTVNVQALFAIE